MAAIWHNAQKVIFKANFFVRGGQKMTRDILSMHIDELRVLISALGHPSYRAEQVFEWLHRRGAAFFDAPFDGMENLPKALRDALKEACHVPPCREAARQTSKDGTVKFLFDCNGVFIETVWMKYNHGYSVCISTQAGCRMGCVFCASAIGGLVRNLSAGEMCAQVYAMPEKVSSIVLMGCGEPLDNFDETLRFIELISHEKGANIGARHITLSTCGLVPEINALAQRKLQINLAVSLHGPTDDVRRRFMPITNRYPVEELMEACRAYADTTRRRVTFEYALASGINDAPAHARQLAKLVKGMLCHVNLIPINKKSSDKSHFSPTPRVGIDAFAAILDEAKIPVTVRRSLGSDISAACGQLRAQKNVHQPE